MSDFVEFSQAYKCTPWVGTLFSANYPALFCIWFCLHEYDKCILCLREVFSNTNGEKHTPFMFFIYRNDAKTQQDCWDLVWSPWKIFSDIHMFSWTNYLCIVVLLNWVAFFFLNITFSYCLQHQAFFFMNQPSPYLL